MGAEIAHGEERAVELAAKQDRNAEQQRSRHLPPTKRGGARGWVPIAEKQLSGGAGRSDGAHFSMIAGVVWRGRRVV